MINSRIMAKEKVYGVMLGMGSAGGRRFWNGVGKYSIVGICLFEITTFVNK